MASNLINNVKKGYKEITYKGKQVKVLFNCFGFPVLSGFVPNINGINAIVEIDYPKGSSRASDYSLANQALLAQMPIGSTPPIILTGGSISIENEKFTWHHHEDGKTMLLIPSTIHNDVFHYGGKFTVDANLKGKLPSFGEILNCN